MFCVLRFLPSMKCHGKRDGVHPVHTVLSSNLKNTIVKRVIYSEVKTLGDQKPELLHTYSYIESIFIHSYVFFFKMEAHLYTVCPPPHPFLYFHYFGLVNSLIKIPSNERPGAER